MIIGGGFLGGGSIGGPTNGLVGAWRCWQADKISATVLADKGPYSYNATLVGSPGFTTDWHSVANRALSLNGSNYATIAQAVANFAGGSFSISFRANLAQNGAYLLGKGDASDGWWFQDGATSVIFKVMEVGGTDQVTLSKTSTTGWHHLVATFAQGGLASLYYDADAPTTGSVAALGSVDYNGNFILGGRAVGDVAGAKVLSDVRLYNRALTPGEIAILAAL